MPKVLLVDDDREVLATLRSMLGRLGYDVAAAENGAQAMQRLRSEPFDLLITDIFMPEMDGIEVIIESRKSGGPDLRIIATSGGGGAGDLSFLEMAMRFGADAQLQKPITLKALAEAIRRCGL
jgi:CheY-like chemotaxis protein